MTPGKLSAKFLVVLINSSTKAQTNYLASSTLLELDNFELNAEDTLLAETTDFCLITSQDASSACAWTRCNRTRVRRVFLEHIDHNTPQLSQCPSPPMPIIDTFAVAL